MNATKKLVEQLRNTASRSKRELLDTAADTIEALMADFLATFNEADLIPCTFCKHQEWEQILNNCSKENCEMYEEGVGCTDERGKYHDWHWSCQDLNFGDCPRLENTPCHGCIQNEHCNFEWRGAHER